MTLIGRQIAPPAERYLVISVALVAVRACFRVRRRSTRTSTDGPPGSSVNPWQDLFPTRAVWGQFPERRFHGPYRTMHVTRDRSYGTSEPQCRSPMELFPARLLPGAFGKPLLPSGLGRRRQAHFAIVIQSARADMP